ncbi:Rieske (2Fe-2S) protein [Streptomyces glaucescens]|uniref:Cytochrome bc1 complex Rieske iron-sulfur subunit n=1 Tax=Streptomyces glaucescens TaxID=1907 RepID=A0A089X7L9_STRGA|nr:Rieske (2Fe-2S) protein [Streptomyces glaucescens]AIR97104.1 iron sulfur protein [Streptomyces glaucescens]
MPTESLHTGTGPARRTVMAAAGAAGLAVALAGCGSDDDGASSGTVLGPVSEVPEGGGKVFADEGVVVTQPTAGEFKAFSSKCTHQGCAVKDVRDGLIICPCHDSHFSASDGSVKKGPATKPLPAARITVEDDEIRLA